MCPVITRAGFPNCDWRGEGREGKGDGENRGNGYEVVRATTETMPCCVLFLSWSYLIFVSTEKHLPSPFPLCIDVGHCFLPSIHVLYSKGTLMLAQMLAEGSFSRPELGRKMTQHLRRHLRSEVPMSFDMWVLYKECFCILGNYQSRI